VTGVASSESNDVLHRTRDEKGGFRIRRFLGLGLSVAALAFQLNAAGTLSVQAGALVASFVGAALVAWRRDRGVGGAAFIYVLVFGLFHSGLVVAVALAGDRMLVGRGANAWAVSAAVPAAVTAVCVAIVAFECGVLLSRPGRIRAVGPVTIPRVSRTDIVGGLGVLGGAILIMISLQGEGGLGALFSGYLQFLEKVSNDSEFGYGVVLLGFGVGFLVASGGRSRVVGWTVVVLIAVVGLPLGLRGTVLFLLVTVLVVEAKRTRINAWLFAIASFVVLVVVAVLRTTRVGGIGRLFEGGFDQAEPLEAVAEMGYSLYPVVVVQEWLAGGLDYRYGVTFVAPIVRFIEAATGADPGRAESDLRIFNVEILTAEGPIGGSPVAEGLRNGGMLGVCLLMLVIGYVIARIDRLPATADGGAITVVVFLPLIIATRNSFAPMLVQIFIGIAMLFAARLLGRIRIGRDSP
jgi:hypothetical protein